ncbi:MAG: signal peptide peptidase SppA [Sphingobium sp.]|nr:MAG: signal peptide peptidase SppA [Sphingobium sp.]
MAFVKGAWRILVAIKDGLVLLFMLLFFGLLYAALSWTPQPARAQASTGALYLDLNGVIVEQPHEVDPLALLTGSGPEMKEYRLRDIVAALDAARDDHRVKAVVLNLDGFMGGGQVALSRVGAALDAVRAKKPVLAYATAYTDDRYQLAAHAGEVWLNPFGEVFLSGPGGSQMYYKGLIDKLGVTTHVYRVGTYKSFVEPYIRTDQSPDAKRADQALVDALWQDWREEVAKARPAALLDPYVKDPVGALRATKGDTAKAALDARLIDKVGSEADFGKRVAAIAGEGDGGKPGDFAAIRLSRYMKAHKPADNGTIGVITVAGEIVDGDAGPGSAAGDTISDLIYTALAEKDLKALVVRVDSPGGSVLAAEKIRAAILEAKGRGLPIVVSMGNVAASGGYWVSTPADAIFAEPGTVTGSIGVFGILPSFEGALAKIGVTTDGVRTTPMSGQPDILGGFAPEFDTVAQAGVEAIYGRFVDLVAQARKRTPEQIDAIAQGRVWDGGTARQIGLVDRFGGLDDAIAEAARRAKIDPAKARPYYIEKEPDIYARYMQQLLEEDDDAQASIPRDWLGIQALLQRQWAVQAVADARGLIEGSAVRAACLECSTFDAPRPATQAQARTFWAWLLGRAW